MTIKRERPYSQFNFQVVIEGESAAGPLRAAFHEVSGLPVDTTELHGSERIRTQKEPGARIKGTHKVGDVTLKRGVIGDLTTLQNWLEQTRADAGISRRTVTIQLFGPKQPDVLREWVLTSARPIKYTGPDLSGKGTDVAIEELVLSSEHVEVKPRP